jgi:CheY-like chemotaxis protein
LTERTIERWFFSFARTGGLVLTARARRWYTVAMEGVQTARPKARVLLVSRLSLFAAGIEELLRQEAEFEIVGRETDPHKAIKRVREAPPDVVILTDGEGKTGLGLELLRLVREGVRIRIVEVHLTTNTVCLYCGERQSIGEVGDLVDTVRHICEGLIGDARVPLAPVAGEPVA